MQFRYLGAAVDICKWSVGMKCGAVGLEVCARRYGV